MRTIVIGDVAQRCDVLRCLLGDWWSIRFVSFVVYLCCLSNFANFRASVFFLGATADAWRFAENL
jgi:hypothetical protein